NQNEWVFRIYDRDTDRPQRISFYVFNLGGGLGSGSYSEQPIQKGEWVYIVGKVDKRYTYIYRNGILANRNRYTVASGEIPAIKPQNGSSPLRIGTGNLTDWFKGSIDEVRISGTARSDAWIKASYYAEKDELIIYRAVNNPPLLEPIGNKSVSAGQTLVFTISATDPDGDSLIYSATGLPPGARFNPSTRTFSWTPSNDQEGVYKNIRFEASDGSLVDFEDIQVIVVAQGLPGTEIMTPSNSVIPSTSPGIHSEEKKFNYLYVILPVIILVFAGLFVFIWFRFIGRRRV
ncbi:MAG: putative Ig domain-containing protein, partial [Dehalococcoidales bacterium]|nr:putative Ig domain-containing protein [Dehalococcoidales bacterium]